MALIPCHRMGDVGKNELSVCPKGMFGRCWGRTLKLFTILPSRRDGGLSDASLAESYPMFVESMNKIRFDPETRVPLLPRLI